MFGHATITSNPLYQWTPAQNEQEAPTLPYLPVQVPAGVAGETERETMQIDDLRDTLAVEIAKIMLTNMLDDLESIKPIIKPDD